MDIQLGKNKKRNNPEKICESCGKLYKYIKFKNKPISIYCKRCADRIIRKKKYYYANREKIILYSKEYLKNNIEKIRESRALIYKKNKHKDSYKLKVKENRKRIKESGMDKVYKYNYRYKNNGKEKDRDWVLNNKDKVKLYKDKYKHSQAGKLSARMYIHRRRSRMKKNGYETITKRQWDDILKKSNYMCVLCGSMDKLEIDHIIPISKGGAHILSNLQPLCPKCNKLKGNKIINK